MGKDIKLNELLQVGLNYIVELEKKYDVFTPGQEEVLLNLYMSYSNEIEDFIKTGFKKDYDDFKETKLFSFVMKLIQKVETFKKLKGEEKRDLIINLLIMVIEKELPIDPILKTALVIIVGKILPFLIDQIIDLTKSLHISSKLCCFF